MAADGGGTIWPYVISGVALVVSLISAMVNIVIKAFNLGRSFVSRDELDKCKEDINDLEKRMIAYEANRTLSNGDPK